LPLDVDAWICSSRGTVRGRFLKGARTLAEGSVRRAGPRGYPFKHAVPPTSAGSSSRILKPMNRIKTSSLVTGDCGSSEKEPVPMWTLILVTFVVSGISTGGVGTTTAFLDFPSEAKCQAAAGALAGADQINPSRGNHPNISPSATYRIIARCVER
jgi:hypothetical protein